MQAKETLVVVVVRPHLLLQIHRNMGLEKCASSFWNGNPITLICARLSLRITFDIDGMWKEQLCSDESWSSEQEMVRSLCVYDTKSMRCSD